MAFLQRLKQRFIVGIEVAQRLAQQVQLVLDQKAKAGIEHGRELHCLDEGAARVVAALKRFVLFLQIEPDAVMLAFGFCRKPVLGAEMAKGAKKSGKPLVVGNHRQLVHRAHQHGGQVAVAFLVAHVDTDFSGEAFAVRSLAGLRVAPARFICAMMQHANPLHVRDHAH